MHTTFTRIAFLVFLFCCLCRLAYSQSWQALGPGGVSDAAATFTSLALDANSTPFVAYADQANLNKVTVRKYTGSSWVDVGSAGFSAGGASEISLVLDAANTPFVAYRDGANGGKATVMKYTGGSWVTVGAAGFSAGEAHYPDIAVDANGIPFVAYQDAANGNKATVKKYTGSSWVDVGPAGISRGETYDISIALDAGGSPIVAFSDFGNGGKATVSRYDGSSWVDVGGAGFSAGEVAFVSLALDAKGIPVVAYLDRAYLGKATVKRFTGSGWVDIGNPGFSADKAAPVLALDASSTPFVAYRDDAVEAKATVKKYNGSAWIDVGRAGFSAGPADAISLAIDANGAPVVAFTDWANGDKATVMRFAAPLPAVTAQPASVTIQGGENARFAAAAAGSGALSYQWQVSRDGGASFSNIRADHVHGDVSTPALTLYKAPISMNGYQYRVQVSDNTGTSFSDAAALTVQVPDFDHTRGWQLVGSRPFAEGFTDFTSLAADSAAVPYVAYRDAANGNKVTVRQYTGSSWETVGPAGFSAGAVGFSPAKSIGFSVRGDETPFVAFKDMANGGKVTVMALWDGSWKTLGAAAPSAGAADDISFKAEGLSSPLVAYSDEAYGNKIVVKKLAGYVWEPGELNWETVGIAGFSSGPASNISLAVDMDETPYVAFADEGNGGKATVKRFNGSSWEDLGGAAASTGRAASISIALDIAGTLYLAYSEEANASKATVKRYVNGGWEVVGAAGVSAGQVAYMSLALDGSGTPAVAYADQANGDKLTVRKYAAGGWADVGTAGFSAQAATHCSLVFDINGRPLVAFGGNSGGSVMELAPLSDITTGRLMTNAYCAGTPLEVPFITTGIFAAGTTFTAQLSDAAGSFAAPRSIGSGTASPVAATLPADAAAGSAYRIRVISAQPAALGTDNGADITISASVAATPGPVSGATTVNPGASGLNYSVAPVPQAFAYYWTVPADWRVAGQGSAAITVTAGSAGGEITVTAINACGESSASRLAVAIAPPLSGNTIGADQAICPGTAPAGLAGTTPTGGSGAALTYLWESSTSGPAEGFAPAPGVNNEKDYVAPTGLTGTTWLRRKVMEAGGTTAVYSNTVTITVMARPLAPRAMPGAQCGPGPVTLRAAGADSDGSYRWYTSAAGGTAIDGATAANFTTPALSATTTYYVAAVSAAGCESNRTAVTATIHPAPVVQVGSDSTVCSSAPAFDLTGFSPEGGSWAGPGVSAAGVFDPATAGPGTHVLTYSYAAASGCRVTAALQVTVATCTGMAEAAMAQEWSLYPNPSPGKIRVKGPVQGRTSLQVRILRNDGSLVTAKTFSQVAGAFDQDFDLTDQAKGLYLLQVITDKGLLIKKFVLK